MQGAPTNWICLEPWQREPVKGGHCCALRAQAAIVFAGSGPAGPRGPDGPLGPDGPEGPLGPA
ncbi:MAG TPA: hypothetical protein VFQ51_09860, partial [Vicinamibacteria bacterium]|nr:hypothetical protein [Vicinamibacteria bacterium]